jgi:uncharacterized protein YjbI with pentapeptide repeats
MSTVDWDPDGPCPCDGSLGVDAQALLARRGSLTGIRSDVATGFVPLPGRDYRGADLSSADLTGQWFKRYDFVCANLRLATLKRVRLLWTDLRWADLRGATLRDGSISASDLRHTDLSGADLKNITFGVAQGNAGWRGCNLAHAKLDGADLRGARYRPETIWPDGFLPEEAGAEPM